MLNLRTILPFLLVGALSACGGPLPHTPGDASGFDATPDRPSTDDAATPDAVVPEDVPTDADCSRGMHRCDGTCVWNSSPDSCGTRCTPCPTPANGSAECVSGECRVVCQTGFHECGGACVRDTDVASCGARCSPCPAAPANGVATCSSGACSFECSAGYVRSGSLCIPSSCPDAQRLCGTACRSCPTANVATTRCSSTGDACVVETCEPGFMPSGTTSCVPLMCSANQRLCAAACRSCPTTGVTATDCSGDTCVATACATGYQVSMGRCEPIVCGTGERLCRNTCSTCPTDHVTATGCSASDTCVATACATGYMLGSDGTCTPVVCPANQRFCGSACTACPTANVATTTCSGTRCVAATCASGYRVNSSTGQCDPFSCFSNERACGTVCAPCPSAGVATTTCAADNTCVPATCQTDFMLSGNTCVPAECPGTQRSCGGACRACPTDNVVTTMCSGPACLAASCADGYGVSGGACVAMSCSTGSLHCGSSCSTCPTTGAATFGCNGGSCVARSCAAGYTLATAVPVGGDRCIASDWSFELIDGNASNSTPSTAIALDAADAVHVAYYAYPDVVHAFRTGTAWTRQTIPAGDLVTVRALAVDARGNAHVVWRQFKQITSFDSTYAWRYARLAPNGTTSMAMELIDERDILEREGVGLTADAAGDAHIVYTRRGPAPGTIYRRTYAGAWLAPQTLGAALGGCDLALDSAEDVHIGCVDGGRISYTRGTSSIFSPAVSSSISGRAFTEVQMYALADGALEIWTREARNFYSTPISAGALGATTPWGSLSNTSTLVTGARGPTDFASLEQRNTSSSLLFRRGPTSGPGEQLDTNLPVERLLDGFVVDRTGVVHALGRRTVSSSRSALYHLIGR